MGYTAQAPRDLIIFLYKLGQEAKKRNKLNSDCLPDDVPIPPPSQWDCSIGSFGSSSDNFLLVRSNILSSYSLLSGSFLTGSKAGSAFYSNYLSLDKIDSTFIRSMPSMDDWEVQYDSSSIKDKESVNEILSIDLHSLSNCDM